MKRKLTLKQQKFADEYIKSGNAADAARQAGYSARTARSVGQENLTKPDIKNYIDDQMAEMASNRIMDAQEAVELLTSIARGEKTETVFVPTINGDVVEEEKTADFKTTISAVKEILKRYPGDDRMLNAQIRKMEAEAEIAEEKARSAKSSGSDVGEEFDKMFKRLKEPVDK